MLHDNHAPRFAKKSGLSPSRRPLAILTLVSLLGMMCQQADAKMNRLFTTANNLSSSLVTEVIEGDDEMIWVATEDGLCRFDGSQFVTYSCNLDDPHALQSNIVLCICAADDGRVLVGTKAGVQMYRPETDDFTPLICDTVQGITAGNVSDLTRLADGDFIVSGTSLFTIHIDEDGEPHPKVNPLTDLLRTSLCCCENYNGDIWTASTVHGLHCYTKEGKLEQIPMDGVVVGVSLLNAGHDGVVYMGGSERGLYKYNPATQRVEEVTRPEDDFRISALSNVPGKKQMYICTDGEGVKILDCQTGKISDFEFDDAQMEIETQKVHSLITSHNGDVWMSIYQKGVMVISPNPYDFNYYGSRSLRYNCIGDRCVTTLLRSHDGMLWVGTDNGGIYGVTDEGQTAVFHSCKEGPNSIPSAISTLFEDSRRRVWFGSYGQGGGLVDLESGDCEYIPLENQRSNTSNINAYAEDSRHNLWVASMGNGIMKYDEKHRTFVRQNLHPACNWAGALFYSAATDRLFVGSFNGLVIVSNLDGEIQCEQYYPKQVVYSISPISTSQISLCTNVGLVIFDTQKREGRLYTTRDGLATNNVFASRMDTEGNLWVSSGKGISKLNLRQNFIINYTSQDGLQFNEFYKNASMRDRDGTLWFGGMQGITWFNPHNIRKLESVLDVRVVRFSNGQNLALPDSDGVYRLEARDQSFTIEMATRPIMQSFSVTYRYSMDNDAWQTLPPTVNRVSFSRIGSGTHRFRFQVDVDGTLSPVKTVNINIASIWFKQWWSVLFGLCFLALVAWLFLRHLQYRYLERKAQLKEAQETADKEEKLQFFLYMAHEIRTPMTLVVSPLQKLIEQDSDPERLRNYRLIDYNAHRVLSVVNEILDLAKLDKAKMQLQCQKLAPAVLVQQLCNAVSGLTKEREISLTFDNRLPEKFTTWIDRGCFEKIVINLLSNAIKYTPRGGAISVESKLTPGQNLCVVVADTGIGIQPEDKPHIFEPFYRSKKNVRQSIGTGIGLYLVRSLAILHHGDVTLDDNPVGRGSVSTFIIPAREDAYTEEERIEQQPDSTVQDDAIDEATFTKMSVVKTIDGAEAGASHPMRHVLIVDDDEDILSYLASELKSIYRVTTSFNGRDAQKKLLDNTDRFDLVVSDVMMPEMDGVDLCRYIRSNVLLNHLPVVLLTAKSSDEDRLKSLEVGANAFISKPFNMEILLKTIKNLIDEHDRLRSSFSGMQLPADKVDTPELQSPDQRLLQRIIQVINDNLNNTELTGEFIAEQVGLSRVHLYRKLKELTNQTARNYIRNIRLAKAAELLTQRRMSISEVAYEVGFSNPNNFATAFKEMYGMSPSAYNEKHFVGDDD